MERERERVRSILASPNKISQRLRMIIRYLEASLISTISEMTRAMESKEEVYIYLLHIMSIYFLLK
jgi:2-iminoacetate synthase ThiH